MPELEHEVNVPDQPESMMPVIRKKESDHIGMFEYKRDQEHAILKALIYGKTIQESYFLWSQSNPTVL